MYGVPNNKKKGNEKRAKESRIPGDENASHKRPVYLNSNGKGNERRDVFPTRIGRWLRSSGRGLKSYMEQRYKKETKNPS
jgi:hypothetical protein